MTCLETESQVTHWRRLIVLAIPVVFLLIEVTCLTTMVEFHDSQMARVANPLLLMGGLWL